MKREDESPLPFGALRQKMSAVWDVNQCLHPLASPGTCNGIIAAHTISRSRVLGKIVNSSNHVLTFYRQDPGKVLAGDPRRVGWRDASTFSGFCARHDAETFAPLEQVPFSGSAEQCFLHAYRAVCHELYQKAGSARAHPAIRDLIDRGMPPELQAKVQRMHAIQTAGVHKGLDDVRRVKAGMETGLLANQFARWSNVRFYLDNSPCFATIGGITPTYTLSGKPLQKLHDVSRQSEWLMLSTDVVDDKGVILFFWEPQQRAPSDFMKSLLETPQSELPTTLLQLVFRHIENLFLSPKWWEELPAHSRLSLARLAMEGNPYYSPYRIDQSIDAPWGIVRTVIENGAA